MTDRSGEKIIDPRKIHPFWYALAIVVSVASLGLFYVMQTTGFSDQANNFSIDVSDTSDSATEG